MKTCTQCNQEFNSSSRHLRCPRCRFGDDWKVPCKCGALKQPKSATCAACRKLAGSANGRWKNGRYRHKAGYIMIRIPDHPRARNNNLYVFEHILVMEDVLGRYLFLDENVHHVNGIKDDNRPENLELWTRPQPSGIRVSDAIAWAHEILARYEHISKSTQNN